MFALKNLARKGLTAPNLPLPAEFQDSLLLCLMNLPDAQQYIYIYLYERDFWGLFAQYLFIYQRWNTISVTGIF